MKINIVLIFTAIIILITGYKIYALSSIKSEGTCSSSGTCTACKNCKFCKNCSQNGGSCSVCK